MANEYSRVTIASLILYLMYEEIPVDDIHHIHVSGVYKYAVSFAQDLARYVHLNAVRACALCVCVLSLKIEQVCHPY